MFKKLFALLAAVLLVAGTARADWIEDAIREKAEKVLTPIVRDIGLGISGGMATKAGPLSFPGAEVSAKAAVVPISGDNEIVDADYLPVPLLCAEAGLPKNIDVFLRGMAISMGGENINIIGGGLRYSFLEDKLLSPLPAVSATVGMNRFNAGDITINATTIGASISKKLLFLTPHAGVTYEMFSSEFENAEVGKIKPEDSLLRFNIGTELNPFPAVFISGGIDFNDEGESDMGFYTALGARVALP